MRIYIIFSVLLIQLNCSTFLGRTSQLSRALKTVYLLPHSHDDVGWLDTVEGIYQRNPGVKNIITSYVNALFANSRRRFVQVEIYYFQKWWNEQSTSMKQKVKKLVENKQLDFACGAWTMNDEATAYYEDVIDQLSDGHKFLFQEFNITVKTGWQIDPFGHSATQSKIHYLMGMDAQFFTRIDYQDKQKRMAEQSLEMIITHQQYQMFTHVNYQHYSSPPGFDFDPFHWNHQSAIMDTQIPSKANTMAQYFTEQFNHYKGKVIAHTLGDDNEWSTAEDYFKNVDKVMDYINERPDDFGIEIRYATPQEFIRSLNEQQIIYPTKQDDFFPYADKAHSYWTGYFTSRTSFKGLIKQVGRQYQQMRNFLSIQLMLNNSYVYNNKGIVTDSVLTLSQAMGIHQHHDAVTGTAKQMVTNDYVKILTSALNGTSTVLHQTVNVLLKQILGEEIDTFYQHNWNTSINNSELYASIVAGKTILLTILDTKYKPIKEMIKLKMPNLPLVIINSENKEINGDLICSNFEDLNDCNLFFILDDDDSLRFQQLNFYKIKVTTPDKSSVKIIPPTELTNITAQSEISLDDGPKFKLTYNYYNSSSDYVQPSGAYIFRPENNTSANYGDITKVVVFNGTLLTELFINRTYCVSRIRKNKFLSMEYEVETHLGSIPNTNSKGREVILVVDTNIKNDQQFYTDSNGLELQRRQVNYRQTWDFDSNEPISENYYPITALIMIEDKKTKSRMAILNDRAQGGSSLKEGQIEIMIHRRMYRDDKRGVGESLNEEEHNIDCVNPVVQKCDKHIPLRQKMIHKIIFFDENSQNAARKVQLLMDLSPIFLYSISSSDKFNLNTENLDDDSSLINKIQLLDLNSGNIADQVKVYTIPWDYNRQFLIRIQNFQESGIIQIVWPNDCKIKETTMNGLQEISVWNSQKLNWKSNTEDTNSQYQSPDQLNPLQIKTYMVTI